MNKKQYTRIQSTIIQIVAIENVMEHLRKSRYKYHNDNAVFEQDELPKELERVASATDAFFLKIDGHETVIELYHASRFDENEVTTLGEDNKLTYVDGGVVRMEDARSVKEIRPVWLVDLQEYGLKHLRELKDCLENLVHRVGRPESLKNKINRF